MSKILVIIGATDGLGKELALHAADDYSVVVVGRSRDKGTQVLQSLYKISDHNHQFYQCNISHVDEITRMIGQIKSDYGTIDILVNNAGIWYEGATIDHDDTIIQQLHQVNVIAPTMMCKYSVPLMQRGGLIINIASTAGINLRPTHGIYASTKASLIAFSKTLQQELLSQGIRVTSFCPGGMSTGFFEAAGFDEHEDRAMMDPKIVAQLLLDIITGPDNILIEQYVCRAI